MNNFNFFKVLEKDDKELIHSAFLAFLLDTDKDFRRSFLHISTDINEFYPSELERSYQKKRIDIILESKDRKFTLVIENKFKSFPNSEQLEEYDRILAKEIKSEQIRKVLFCFDKNILPFNTEWEKFDYKELLFYLKKDKKYRGDDDKSVFVKHYISFLDEYMEEYNELMRDCSYLFKKKELTKKEKFFLRIVNSQVALELKKNMSQEVHFVVNPGNTPIPLINIIPADWGRKINNKIDTSFENRKLLIQFQKNDLKFYIHSENIEEINNLVNYCKARIEIEAVEFKDPLKGKKGKSCFIFKKKINPQDNEVFNYKSISKIILDFYKEIEVKIMN